MTDKLYEWLRREFYSSNYNKYRHLFEEWVKKKYHSVPNRWI